MTYGRSLERYIKRFDLPQAYYEWAHIARNFADWRKRVTEPLFAIGKPLVRRLRGDGRMTAGQKRGDEARRAAETAERQATYRGFVLADQGNLTGHESVIECNGTPILP